MGVGDAERMLTETYIEALLVDGALADLIWAAWNRSKISDETAATPISKCMASLNSGLSPIR